MLRGLSDLHPEKLSTALAGLSVDFWPHWSHFFIP